MEGAFPTKNPDRNTGLTLAESKSGNAGRQHHFKESRAHRQRNSKYSKRQTARSQLTQQSERVKLYTSPL